MTVTPSHGPPEPAAGVCAAAHSPDIAGTVRMCR